MRPYTSNLVVLALALSLVGCGQWDKEPVAIQASTPPTLNAEEQVQKAYAENWCAPAYAVPPSVQFTVKLIRDSALGRAPEAAPRFSDLPSECRWIAQTVVQSGELHLAKPAGATEATIDLRPVSIFTSVKTLDIAGWDLEPSELSQLNLLSDLESINLNANPKIASDVASLAKLFPKLRSLSLEHCSLTDRLSLRFDVFKELKELSLSDNRLQGSPLFLPATIEVLNLGSNEVTHSKELALSHLASLHSLNLSKNQLSEAPLLPPNLKVLDLSENGDILTEEAFAQLKKQKAVGQLTELTHVLVGKADDAETERTVNYLNQLNLGINLSSGDKP